MKNNENVVEAIKKLLALPIKRTEPSNKEPSPTPSKVELHFPSSSYLNQYRKEELKQQIKLYKRLLANSERELQKLEGKVNS